MSEDLLWEVGVITRTSGKGWSIIAPLNSVNRDDNILIPETMCFSVRTGTKVEFVRTTGYSGWVAAAVRIAEQ